MNTFQGDPHAKFLRGKGGKGGKGEYYIHYTTLQIRIVGVRMGFLGSFIDARAGVSTYFRYIGTVGSNNLLH